jgi:hypothetical protein
MISFIAGGLLYAYRTEDKNIKWKTTVCEVVRIVPGRSGGNQFVYYVDDTEFEGWTESVSRRVELGDRYIVAYDSADHSNYKWIVDTPLTSGSGLYD